jgi:hypothetical protein
MTRLSVTVTLAATICMAVPAAAQNQSGPMTIERIQNGPLGAPEVKITDVDGHLSTLVGGEAGWMTDRTFFVGAAGYWMVNGAHDQGMGYGGLTLHWWWHGSQPIGFGAKGLIGGGTATLLDTYTQRVPPYPVPVPRGATPQTYTYTVWYNRGFFIFEPEGDAFVRLNDHLRVTAGVSYRVVGADGNTDNRIRGVAGTVGVQIF